MSPFVTWYASEIKKQLDDGQPIEKIEVDLRLSPMKPPHAQSLTELFNFFTTEPGREITIKGWKKAGILGLLDGSAEPSICYSTP